VRRDHRIVVACLTALLAGCGSPLQEGNYALTAKVTAATTDTCHLVGAGGSLPTLYQVRFSGSVAMLSGTLPGSGEVMQIEGRRQSVKDGAPETFFATGAVQDRPFMLEGTSCSVHFGQVQITATVDSATTFNGTYTLFYDLWADQPAGCPIRCDLAVGYDAVRAGP
jgi:hypothetical protein